MRSQPATIDGIAGPIAVDVHWFTGRHAVTVGGRPAAKTGRRTFQLPTVDGRVVEATARSTFFDAYPTVTVGGVAHRLGPPTSVGLRVLMLLPFVLIAGGAIGVVIGLLAIPVNAAIVRGPVSLTAKIVLMIAVFGVAVVTWFVLAVALRVAIS